MVKKKKKKKKNRKKKKKKKKKKPAQMTGQIMTIGHSRKYHNIP